MVLFLLGVLVTGLSAWGAHQTAINGRQDEQITQLMTRLAETCTDIRWIRQHLEARQ